MTSQNLTTGAGWSEAYLAERDRLTRLATMLVGPADAHDLVVDTVYRCICQPGWSSLVAPGPYLTRSLVNAAESLRRSSSRRQAREQRSWRVCRSNEPSIEVALDVRRAMRSLSTQQRAIAYFVYWEDLDLAAVARRLDVGEGTVRKQFERAKVKLRTSLREVNRHVP